MQPTQQSLAVPIAIVIGFGIIAATLYATYERPERTQPATVSTSDPIEAAISLQAPISKVGAGDHFRGNPNAPILFVTYTSFECPECRNFHVTMSRLVQDLGQDGDIAWVLRHLPLDEDYPNDSRLAMTALCVGTEAGSPAYWQFTDELFHQRGQARLTELSRVPEFVTTAGADPAAVERCVNNGTYRDLVRQQREEALAAGAFGTPFTVIITPDETGVIHGTQPYTAMREIAEVALTLRQD